MKIYSSIVLLFLALSQAFGQRFVKVFNTIDAMRTASPDVHTNAFVAGSSTLNDGGQGLFTWDASSTAATNTETIFGSTKVSTGRWFRQSGAGLDNNWTDEGTTNSTLAGIAKPWALHATSYIAVTNATGSAGFIDLPSTNGTYVLTLTVGSDGSLQVNYGTTNMLKVLVGDSSGYAGGGTKALFDDGTFKSVSSGSITNLNPNPTDGYIPYRSNATVFGDSALFQSATNVGMNSIHYFYGLNSGGNYERLALNANTSSSGTIYNNQAAGTGTYRNHTFQIGGTNRLEIWSDGTYLFNPQGTNGYIYLQGSSSSGSFYAQANGTIASVTAGTERIRLEPSASSAPFKFDSARAIGTAGFFTIKNLGTNIFSVSGVSGYSGVGTLVLTDDGTYKAPNTFASGTNFTILAVSNPSTAVTTGVTNYWPISVPITIKSVTARLLNPSTSGDVTLDLTKNGTTVLSAPVTISAGGTNTAATVSVTTATTGDALIGYVTAAGANAAGATLIIGYTAP